MRHGELKHIYDALERAFAKLRIDYYLIGALARQVWYENAGLGFRTTKDVDYAVLIGCHQEPTYCGDSGMRPLLNQQNRWAFIEANLCHIT